MPRALSSAALRARPGSRAAPSPARPAARRPRSRPARPACRRPSRRRPRPAPTRRTSGPARPRPPRGGGARRRGRQHDADERLGTRLGQRGRLGVGRGGVPRTALGQRVPRSITRSSLGRFEGRAAQPSPRAPRGPRRAPGRPFPRRPGRPTRRAGRAGAGRPGVLGHDALEVDERMRRGRQPGLRSREVVDERCGRTRRPRRAGAGEQSDAALEVAVERHPRRWRTPCRAGRRPSRGRPGRRPGSPRASVKGHGGTPPDGAAARARAVSDAASRCGRGG